jgi:hypothetical protein
MATAGSGGACGCCAGVERDPTGAEALADQESALPARRVRAYSSARDAVLL